MKNASVIVNALTLMLLTIGASSAAFDDMGIGARPLGMGGAFVAVADDANASRHNPAGLGYMTAAEAGFTHVRMFSGVVNYNYAGVALPLGAAGSFGVSFGMLSEESNIYTERDVAFSYAKKVVESLSLGANLRMLNTSFDDDNQWVKENQYFAETSASGFTLDLGVLAMPVKGLNIGLSAANLLPADISVSESEEEKIPVNLQLGLAYKLSAIAASAQQPALKEVLETMVISIEGALRKEREMNALKVRAGVEAWFANQVLGLRAGYRMKKLQESSSSATVGGSIRIPVAELNLQLDYALQILGADIEDKLAHRLSVVLSL